MNQRAKALRLNDSEFHSVHGLPPGAGQRPDLMSAADLAIVARKLAEFPEIMEWAKLPEAPFRDGQLQMRNTNHLVRTYPGADGLKTGYYAAAGFEVTATASRDGLRLVAVVLGVPTKKGCFDKRRSCICNGFATTSRSKPPRPGNTVGDAIVVAGGSVPSLTGIAAEISCHPAANRGVAGEDRGAPFRRASSAPSRRGGSSAPSSPAAATSSSGAWTWSPPWTSRSTSWWRGRFSSRASSRRQEREWTCAGSAQVLSVAPAQLRC